MTFTADSAQNFFSDISNYSTQKSSAITSAIAVLRSLNVDERLALLWFIHTKVGYYINPAATGPARLHLFTGLLNQIKLMSNEEQLQVMRDLIAQKNTQISRSYGIFSNNTKLAFWYELSELMEQGIVIPISTEHELSPQGKEAIELFKKLGFAQQITVLRKVVTEMGVNPFIE
ncbi:orange carotenoid protein N-terminal domain-containing protein [Mastigocoleus sp. MO_188.B34]|uniref:orange carotenoid protein N-terminal domain-containing protein n=1 Tax=Mastigocoleus sp. MO_188.B34 TaxID=3036635 RepID=UPI00260496F2|nr:orange carotenoid protein N-terminal domain-containing protein [Mastigocoleus sp. MO_188.B34]MDJ0695019.1 orange carotenoid protein N-terminal domain-containing protein [Mastigocoleus sp. MO_188.B34]